MENPHPPIRRRVCVLGAGIVGLATAWALSRDGHEVVVLDRAQAGMDTSQANGAQLSYAYVQPLADPGIWRQLPKLLLAGDSPLRWRLQLDPAQWRWLTGFLAACRSSVSRQTTVELLALAEESRQGLARLMAEEAPDFDHAVSGKLVLYPDAASFAAARRQMALQRTLGSHQEALSPAECRSVEPALAHAHSPFAGGIHTPGEAAADCHRLCQELVRILRRRGVQFLLDTEVLGLQTDRGRIVRALTRSAAIEADAYVLSLGTGSVPLAQALGIHLPLYPLKGYSLTADANPTPGHAPQVSVTDAGRKVVFARLGQRLRVAGMVELVGHNRDTDPSRIDALLRTARDLFPQASDWVPHHTWAGLRPATPTGRPIHGRLAGGPQNLLFNTGHGALGFTLAFGSAARIARAMDLMR